MRKNIWAGGIVFAGSMVSMTVEATTEADLYQAMEVDASDVLSATVAGSTDSYDTVTDLGLFLPEMGSDMAFSTRARGTSARARCRPSALWRKWRPRDARIGTHSTCPCEFFRAVAHFFSAEYPEGQTAFNDTFELNVVGSAYSAMPR